MNLLLAFLLGVFLTAFASLGYSLWQRIENERTYHSIIQGSPIPTFVIRKNHTVLYWNKALEVLSGIKLKEIAGTNKHWMAFYRQERPCLADLIVDEALDTGYQWYPDNFIKSGLIKDAYEATGFFPDLGKNGKWIRITAAAIRDSRGRISGAIETLEDITDRKHAEDELLRMKKLESLGTFASGVAEDFDSLLSAILRNIFLAKISMDDEDKILEEGLAIAEKAGLQAKELAHKLITFSRGGFPLRKTEPIDGLLTDVVESIKESKDLKVCVSMPPDLWPVHGDIKQLRQVFQNIIQNSVDSMPNGGIFKLVAENVNIGKEMPPLRPGDYVKVTIKDSGYGIGEDDLTRIFDPYFTTKRDAGRGIGLGLAVSYSIVKNHNGIITVESSGRRKTDNHEEAGTTFKIYLPVNPQQESTAQ
ncbi:MAG: ATP-binding protein [Syntrophales bacterium]|nr:ATP-binding protein [Syntrophales bacterium]